MLKGDKAFKCFAINEKITQSLTNSVNCNQIIFLLFLILKKKKSQGDSVIEDYAKIKENVKI